MSHNKQVLDESLERVRVLLNSKLREPVKFLTGTESDFCYTTLIEYENLNPTMAMAMNRYWQITYPSVIKSICVKLQFQIHDFGIS